MKAAFYERYGAASDVLEVGEIPDVEVGPGEVQVRVASSAVNPSDVKARAGSRGPMRSPLIVPHSDGAGTIEAVGAGVSPHLVGQRVWVWEAQWRRPWGTAAERTVVPMRSVAPLPETASFDVGACLGIPALTAHRCLFARGPVEGRTVLVNGATGRVGAYALQLAKHGGAIVLATVGSDDKVALAAKLGADHVLSYRSDQLASDVRDLTDGRGVDRIVEADLGANFSIDAAMLAPGGSIASYASTTDFSPPCPVYPLMLANATLEFVLVYDMPEEAKQAAARDINDMIAADRLEHQIALRVPLAQIVKAHEAVEQNHARGCVLIGLEDAGASPAST